MKERFIATLVQRLKLGIPMSHRCLTVCVFLILTNFSETASAQAPCAGIHVEILDIRNSTGSVACALFESPDGFPTEFMHSATQIVVIKIRDTQAICDFEGIVPGSYALAVIHDENMNGKLDTRYKIPQEGYGFSNDAKAWFGAPSFSAANFQYDGKPMEMKIRLRY